MVKYASVKQPVKVGELFDLLRNNLNKFVPKNLPTHQPDHPDLTQSTQMSFCQLLLFPLQHARSTYRQEGRDRKHSRGYSEEVEFRGMRKAAGCSQRSQIKHEGNTLHLMYLISDCYNLNLRLEMQKSADWAITSLFQVILRALIARQNSKEGGWQNPRHLFCSFK